MGNESSAPEPEVLIEWTEPAEAVEVAKRQRRRQLHGAMWRLTLVAILLAATTNWLLKTLALPNPEMSGVVVALPFGMPIIILLGLFEAAARKPRTFTIRTDGVKGHGRKDRPAAWEVFSRFRVEETNAGCLGTELWLIPQAKLKYRQRANLIESRLTNRRLNRPARMLLPEGDVRNEILSIVRAYLPEEPRTPDTQPLPASRFLFAAMAAGTVGYSIVSGWYLADTIPLARDARLPMLAILVVAIFAGPGTLVASIWVQVAIR